MGIHEFAVPGTIVPSKREVCTTGLEGMDMSEPLWRKTREKMFEAVKQTMVRARKAQQAQLERGKPALGVAYWYINDRGVIENNKWEGDRFDTGRWEIGNVFHTPQEAEHAREKIKEVLVNFREDA
jgi:hypothetical protein